MRKPGIGTLDVSQRRQAAPSPGLAKPKHARLSLSGTSQPFTKKRQVETYDPCKYEANIFTRVSTSTTTMYNTALSCLQRRCVHPLDPCCLNRDRAVGVPQLRSPLGPESAPGGLQVGLGRVRPERFRGCAFPCGSIRVTDGSTRRTREEKTRN